MLETIIKGAALQRNIGPNKRRTYIGARGIPRKLGGRWLQLITDQLLEFEQVAIGVESEDVIRQ